MWVFGVADLVKSRAGSACGRLQRLGQTGKEYPVPHVCPAPKRFCKLVHQLNWYYMRLSDRNDLHNGTHKTLTKHCRSA